VKSDAEPLFNSWDPVWEKVFSAGDWGKYPPEELVRFVARNYFARPDHSSVQILDAGCGPGAGAWFMAREGFSVIGLDGSSSALKKAQNRLDAESLAAGWVRGDLVALPFRAETFDAVTDVAAISQNRLGGVRGFFSEVYRVLKPGGRFFVMLFRAGCWGDGMGLRVESGTYTHIAEGPLAGKGTTHFFSEEEIRDLFQPFRLLSWETSLRTYENRTREISFWVVIAEK
jgi:ubiquinone/menaquinone biosynthesis C-methylase UbiE